MSIDIDVLSRQFFYVDKPVEYTNLNKQKIKIYPVLLKDSEYFLESLNILNIDKNSLPDVKIIQMSYLQFICEYLLKNESYLTKFINILLMCLHLENPVLNLDDKGKVFIGDKDKDIIISPQDFEDIRRIILYQNIINFDDSYIAPDLKKAIDEVNDIRNKNYEVPSLERKIAIITSHCGLSKKEQLEMTYRSHTLLFEEVAGEVDYLIHMPIAMYVGQSAKVENWIFKRKKNKFEQYITSVDEYNKSMGANKNAIKSVINNDSEQLMKKFENFSKN